VRGRLDSEFPVDSPEGERRVVFFRVLKAVMKQFGGRYQMFHNFASGGICPDDAAAQRTVDRVYVMVCHCVCRMVVMCGM